MLAVQKPVNPFFSSTPSHYRTSHSRHPSAPVIVRPTHTPGLLSLSKPASTPLSRPHPAHANARAPRSPPKGKSQRSNVAQPTEDVKKSPATKNKADAVSSVVPPVCEKSTRGRQQSKPASKDKNDRRSLSLSSSRTPARRPAHQPSPPPPSRIPNQTDVQAPVNPLRAQSFVHRDSDSNLFDPFLVHPSSDRESPEPTTVKPVSKPIAFSSPKLSYRPSGNLARRRHPSAQFGPSVLDTPTPSKAVPVSRSKRTETGGFLQVTSRRPTTRRVSTAPAWDFPICDDSDDVTPPSTPVRESASVPSKPGVTWQQESLFFDEAPRTAPLSSTFDHAHIPSPTASPTPAQRRRHHRRVPSEGMFSMSMDEDSSSSDAGSPKRREAVAVRRSPSPSVEGSLPAGFYAGSVFQNSPSPEELPVPAFMA
ncbi:hypothetical protein ABKN59_011530 [Abortiporus biennis]